MPFTYSFVPRYNRCIRKFEISAGYETHGIDFTKPDLGGTKTGTTSCYSNTEPGVYFNGKKIHDDVSIQQVWGGPNSGLDGGNDGGKGITDRPGGLKLQAEGHDVLYRNVWIKELELDGKSTDF